MPAVPTGHAMLDAELPGGGWPRAALVEILTAYEGLGALRLVAPALARLSDTGRWLAFIAPPHVPYAPALVAMGIELTRVLVVHERDRKRMLWALEQSLRSGACAAVLAWLGEVEMAILRRLQLAAVAGDAIGFVFRPRAARAVASPAVLRVALEVISGEAMVEILKCRQRAPGRCRLPAVAFNGAACPPHLDPLAHACARGGRW
jgi:cell division inhibitor SulA/protein ImuA